jgi:hypothetical protein
LAAIAASVRTQTAPTQTQATDVVAPKMGNVVETAVRIVSVAVPVINVAGQLTGTIVNTTA